METSTEYEAQNVAVQLLVKEELVRVKLCHWIISPDQILHDHRASITLQKYAQVKSMPPLTSLLAYAVILSLSKYGVVSTTCLESSFEQMLIIKESLELEYQLIMSFFRKSSITSQQHQQLLLIKKIIEQGSCQRDKYPVLLEHLGQLSLLFAPHMLEEVLNRLGFNQQGWGLLITVVCIYPKDKYDQARYLKILQDHINRAVETREIVHALDLLLRFSGYVKILAQEIVHYISVKLIDLYSITPYFKESKLFEVIPRIIKYCSVEHQKILVESLLTCYFNPKALEAKSQALNLIRRLLPVFNETIQTFIYENIFTILDQEKDIIADSRLLAIIENAYQLFNNIIELRCSAVLVPLWRLLTKMEIVPWKNFIFKHAQWLVYSWETMGLEHLQSYDGYLRNVLIPDLHSNYSTKNNKYAKVYILSYFKDKLPSEEWLKIKEWFCQNPIVPYLLESEEFFAATNIMTGELSTPEIDKFIIKIALLSWKSFNHILFDYHLTDKKYVQIHGLRKLFETLREKHGKNLQYWVERIYENFYMQRPEREGSIKMMMSLVRQIEKLKSNPNQDINFNALADLATDTSEEVCRHIAQDILAMSAMVTPQQDKVVTILLSLLNQEFYFQPSNQHELIRLLNIFANMLSLSPAEYAAMQIMSIIDLIQRKDNQPYFNRKTKKMISILFLEGFIKLVSKNSSLASNTLRNDRMTDTMHPIQLGLKTILAFKDLAVWKATLNVLRMLIPGFNLPLQLVIVKMILDDERIMINDIHDCIIPVLSQLASLCAEKKSLQSHCLRLIHRCIDLVKEHHTRESQECHYRLLKLKASYGNFICENKEQLVQSMNNLWNIATENMLMPQDGARVMNGKASQLHRLQMIKGDDISKRKYRMSNATSEELLLDSLYSDIYRLLAKFLPTIKDISRLGRAHSRIYRALRPIIRAARHEVITEHFYSIDLLSTKVVSEYCHAKPTLIMPKFLALMQSFCQVVEGFIKVRSNQPQMLYFELGLLLCAIQDAHRDDQGPLNRRMLRIQDRNIETDIRKAFSNIVVKLTAMMHNFEEWPFLCVNLAAYQEALTNMICRHLIHLRERLYYGFHGVDFEEVAFNASLQKFEQKTVAMPNLIECSANIEPLDKTLFSAQRGDGLSLYNMGRRFDVKHSTNLKVAITYYRIAESMKFELARIRLAYLHEKGRFPEMTDEEMITIYRSLSDNLFCCHRLAKWYEYRAGERQNYSTIASLFYKKLRVNAKKNPASDESHYYLGWLYQHGKGGVTQNNSRAREHYLTIEGESFKKRLKKRMCELTDERVYTPQSNLKF